MGSNYFGKRFVFTTWGESHGKAVGVVIDGCPSGIEIDRAMIDRELAKRAPGKSIFTSPRREPDRVEIISGLFEGKTTGAPISLLIRNRDVKSRDYESLKYHYRPGHVSFTYLKKYGVYDH
ncbi:MAG: chorismate synthase, partial [Chlamydiia bacterium]|nr:chorismate synthase [Chlamydiia bacterium]